MKFCFKFAIFALLFSNQVLAQTGSWTKMASYPGVPTDAASAFSLNGKIYFGGGEGLHKLFFEYDPATNKWAKKADIPSLGTSRAFGISFAVGGKGYVALGQSDYSAMDAQGTVTNDVWAYDPTSDTWAKKANFPGERRDGAMAFTIGDKAYVGAGVNFNNASDFGDFYEYDPAVDKWTAKADLPGGPVAFPMGFSIGSFGYWSVAETTASLLRPMSMIQSQIAGIL